MERMLHVEFRVQFKLVGRPAVTPMHVVVGGVRILQVIRDAFRSLSTSIKSMGWARL